MAGDEKGLALIGQLESISWQRLYRLEIQKFEAPGALAPEPAPPVPASRFSRIGQSSPASTAASSAGEDAPGWRRLALVYDVHDRTPEHLKKDVLGLLEGETGRFRIYVFYWEGDMLTPSTGKLMGRGEDFLYSGNPRGDTVSVAKDPIEFEIEED